MFSLISTMTWDTGFNIRWSTFICKKTHCSDSLSIDSTEDPHGDHQMTSSLLCSCCLVLSLWSVELCTGSLVDVIPAGTRWRFNPASGISLISCNTAKIGIFLLHYTKRAWDATLWNNKIRNNKSTVLLTVCEKEEVNQSLDGPGCWIRCVV